jgi:hypothetical protein
MLSWLRLDRKRHHKKTEGEGDNEPNGMAPHDDLLHPGVSE